MSKPVYELPDDGESYPPAASRRGRRAAENPTVSPDFGQPPQAASYLNAPPPTSKPFPAPSPAAEAAYADSAYPEIKFDPSAPAPAPASSVFDLGAPSGVPFNFDDFAPPAPAGASFDLDDMAPPAAGSTPFDLDDFAPPAAAPFNPDDFAPPVAHSTPFDLDDMAPPASPAASSAPFNAADYPPPAASSPAPPVFDPPVFDPPVFDPSAFAPPTASSIPFDAPPPAFDPPVYEAPVFDAPAYPAPAAATPAPPMPWDAAPAPAAPAAPAPVPAPASSDETPTTVFAFPAAAPVDEPLPATTALSFDDLAAFAAPTVPPVVAPPAAAPVEEPPAAETSSLLSDLGFRSGAHAAPVAEASAQTAPEDAPEVGLGQEGSDPDLVAALNAVVALKGSDLHVTAKATPMLRVDGGLEPLPGAPVWDQDKLAFALKSIMSAAQIEQFEAELELDFAYKLSENSRFRVNIYQQRDSMGAAFRLIPTKIKQLAELGVPDTIGKFAALPRGLVLVTGPTGSGKSTTLAALIDLVNRTRADHIVTVEDPIEFMHENKKSLVNQREVGHDTHSFNNALKHVLRQDPDVILIGELRDLETISVALTAAETGHLVFATLHTQDAPQTIDRVIDVFPPHQQGQVRAQLAAVLQGVVCQTLVKSATGKGRVVATEVMVATSAIANLIREGKTYQIHSALQAGRDLGMFTLDQHLAELVDAGKITHAAAMEKAHDTDGLKQLIHRVDQGASVDHKMSTSGVDFGDQYSSMPVTR
jgi:twitching motility protein PilT